MHILGLFILFMYILFFFALAFIFIYILVDQLQARKKEQFNKRDN